MSLEISDHPSDKRYVEQFRLARQLANDKKDSSKNVIIAFGCSFTDPYFRVDSHGQRQNADLYLLIFLVAGKCGQKYLKTC